MVQLGLSCMGHMGGEAESKVHARRNLVPSYRIGCSSQAVDMGIVEGEVLATTGTIGYTWWKSPDVDVVSCAVASLCAGPLGANATGAPR